MSTLEAPYATINQADQAANAYFSNQGGGGGDGGGGGGSGGDGDGDWGGLGEASGLSGSLQAPGAVAPGQAFQAPASITNNSGSQTSLTARLMISFDESGSDLNGNWRLANQQVQLEAGGSAEFTYSVPNGTIPQADETVDLALLALGTSEATTGVVATTTLDITPGGDERTPEDVTNGWGNSYYVQQLAWGWHLYAQDHEEQGKTRYIISGTTAESVNVYLGPEGFVHDVPKYFTSVDAISQALSAYQANVEAGEIPSERQPDESTTRPSPESVTQDVMDAASGPGGATVDNLLGQVESWHVAVAAVVIGAAVYYRYYR